MRWPLYTFCESNYISKRFVMCERRERRMRGVLRDCDKSTHSSGVRISGAAFNSISMAEF